MKLCCVVAHKNPHYSVSNFLSSCHVKPLTSGPQAKKHINHSHPTHKKYNQYRVNQRTLCGSIQQCENVCNGHKTTAHL